LRISLRAVEEDGSDPAAPGHSRRSVDITPSPVKSIREKLNEDSTIMAGRQTVDVGRSI